MITSYEALHNDTFTLPQHKDWRRFAAGVNGYTVGEELGFNVHEWGYEQVQQWEAAGSWDLGVPQLRLVLFYLLRLDYWTGYTYTENDAVVDSVLQAISQQTGLGYEPLSPDAP